MAKRIKQYRFFGDDSAQVWSDVVSGAAFSREFGRGVYQLGIQALPGTKFKLNNSPGWIILGTNGIFDLNLANKARITSLCFEADSVAKLRQNNGLILLVDIVYQGE